MRCILPIKVGLLTTEHGSVTYNKNGKSIKKYNNNKAKGAADKALVASTSEHRLPVFTICFVSTCSSFIDTG